MIEFLLPSILAGIGIAIIAGASGLLLYGAKWPTSVTLLPMHR